MIMIVSNYSHTHPRNMNTSLYIRLGTVRTTYESDDLHKGFRLITPRSATFNAKETTSMLYPPGAKSRPNSPLIRLSPPTLLILLAIEPLESYISLKRGRPSLDV